MTTKSKGPAEAIDEMKLAYDCAWPPKPDFNSWPASWLPYQTVCDVMPYRLHQGDPQAFRKWMIQELESQLNLDAVMSDLYQRWRRSDRQVLGLLGCLAFLKNAYRWRSVPPLEEEKQRTSMQFPDIINRPMTEVATLHGVNPFAHVFSIHIANTIYEGDKAVHTRFHFNTDPKVIRTEENFFLTFVIIKRTFQPAVDAMQEYCILTEEASNSHAKAITNLARRVQLLEVIQTTMMAAHKVFRTSLQGDKINAGDFTAYVQVPASWGLDGNGGGSGLETFIFQLLDEFLHVPGKCLMYTSKALHHGNMPDAIHNVVKTMAISDPGPRFNSYLGIEQSKDPLWKGREAILKSLHLWRLGHAHVVGRVITKSKGLASGLEKKMEDVECISTTAEKELLQRARETQNQFRKEKPQVQQVQAPKVTLVNTNNVFKYVGYFLWSAGYVMMSTFLA